MVEDMVISGLMMDVLTADRVRDLVAAVNAEMAGGNIRLLDEITAKEREIAELKTVISRLLDAIERGTLSGMALERYRERERELEERERELKELNAAVKAMRPVEVRIEEIERLVGVMRLSLERGPISERQKFLQALISRVELHNEYVKVMYSFPIENVGMEGRGIPCLEETKSGGVMVVPPRRVERLRMAPEATALSTELRGQDSH